MSLLDTTNLPHTCTAYKRARTKGTLGGSRDTFTGILFAGRKCWRQAVGDSQINAAARNGVSITDRVYFNADPGLDEGHVLVFADDPAHQYAVVSFAEPNAGAGLGPPYRVYVNRTTVEA